MTLLSYGQKEISKVVYGHRISVMNASTRAAFLKAYGGYKPPVSFTLPNSCGALAGLIWIPFQGVGVPMQMGYETLAAYIGKSVFRDHAVLARMFLPGQVCIAMTRYIEDAAHALHLPLVKLVREPGRWLSRGSLQAAGTRTRSFGSDPTLPSLTHPSPPCPASTPTLYGSATEWVEYEGKCVPRYLYACPSAFPSTNVLTGKCHNPDAPLVPGVDPGRVDNMVLPLRIRQPALFYGAIGAVGLVAIVALSR